MPAVGLDEKRHVYTRPGTGEEFQSNTTILGAVEDKPWTGPWWSKLTVNAAFTHLERVCGLLAAGQPDTARKLIRDTATEARELAARIGSFEHDVYEQLLLDKPLPLIPPDLVGQVTRDGDVVCQEYVDSIADGWMQFFTDYRLSYSHVEAAELTVCDPILGWAGTLDAMLRMPGIGMRSVDWKTGRNKSTTWKAQVATYDTAPETWPGLGMIVAKPPTDGAAILHIRSPKYPDGYARGYKLYVLSPQDHEAGRRHFLRALAAFHSAAEQTARPGDVWYPPLEDGSQPLPMLEDIRGYSGAPGALRRAGLGPDATLDAVAEFTAQELLRASGIGPKRLAAIGEMLADHGLTLAATLAAVDVPTIADAWAGVA